MPRARKPKKPQPDFPATEPKAEAEAADQSPLSELLASREAKSRVEPDAPMPVPEIIHAQKLAPKNRSNDDQFGFYVSDNLRVSKDRETYKGLTRGLSIEIKRPLTNETRDGETMYVSAAWNNKLTGYGFDDISEKGDGSLWLADIPQLMEGRPETLRILMNRINTIGPQLDGKFQRASSEERGR